jgi:hypothetical protein
MFSNDKKPGGVSNWFLSLRRQPKKQKSLDSSKLLQKSCVDLTGAGGASSSEQDLLFRSPTTATKPSKLKLNNNSSNNNNDDTSLASNSCTNCCCKFSSKTSSPSFGVSPIIDDDEIEQTDQLRKVLITNEENYSAAGEKSVATNFSTNLLLYNKKEEFSRTTRTVTTKITSKTLISGAASSSSKNLHHRIGLVFNENGQLINRRQLLNAKNRDGLIFDEHGRLMYSDSDETAPLTPASSILDDSTIEFIDSSSQNSDIYNRANMQQQHKCSCNGSKLTLTNSSSLLSNTKSDWSSCNNRQVIGRRMKETKTIFAFFLWAIN